jgi:YidC/Oxa1 family membrane protein insertase
MIALAAFQWLLDSIGWLLAQVYDLVGNYGLAIIILTIVIKIILLPLGIKQIKSMQAMQAIQPKIKELQKKYKGNKQKAQEETMKLYKEAGVNPLGGCLPLLLQFPILIAMYAVIRAPIPNAAYDPQTPKPGVEAYLNNHLPTDSQLYDDITNHPNTGFLWLNLQCSAAQSGTQAVVNDSARKPTGKRLDCGSSAVDKVPYFVFLAVMIGTTFYQQRQMQRASPPGAASGQQQTLLKVMPIMFGIFGYAFPAGLVLYWTTSNLWQIGQQHALLRAGHIGPEALDRRIAEQRARGSDMPAKQGFFARLMERANYAQQQRGKQQPGARKPQAGGSGRGGSGRSGSGKGSGSGGSGGGAGSGSGRPKTRRPNTGRPRRPNDPRRRPGGDNGGDGKAGG